jgi:predicted molibdopterin-dependent oxidoreductase YjgC
VNDYWMCDEGRSGYQRIQGEHRLPRPEIRRGEELQGAPWEEATAEVVSRLRAIRDRGAVAGIVSAFATNEEGFLFRRLLGGDVAGHAWSPPDAYGDDLLIKKDKNPNRKGLESLGIATSAEAVDGILERARSGAVKALVVFGADIVGDLGRERVEHALEALDLFVLIDIKRSETALYADVLLPSASFAETDGTFTNHAGRVQRIRKAFEPAGEALEGWKLLATLLEKLGDEVAWTNAEQVFAALTKEARPFAGLDYATLAERGAPLSA